MNKKLYQLDSLNKIRTWEITVQDNNAYSTIYISTGLMDGQKVTTQTNIFEGKNIGKANETTHWTQALSEAQSKIDSQIKKGYVDDLKNLKKSTELGSGIPAPMLAQKYHPTGEQKSSKTLKQLGLVGKEIYVQPKLDGNRCLIKKVSGEYPVMYTRSGDVMPVQLKHILNDVNRLDGDFILDGELFSEKFSFNRLNGLIKREKANEQDLQDRREIKYHLYDTMNESDYQERYQFLGQFASNNIVIVESFRITATNENINKYLEAFLRDGHEGLMIRQITMPYEHKRSWQLCKVKVFEDEEFELIGFEEDKRGGFVGAFVMKDKQGNIFNAGASGQSEEERKEMWNNQSKYIGKMGTVCFFGRSEYGIPRFPKFKGARD